VIPRTRVAGSIASVPLKPYRGAHQAAPRHGAISRPAEAVRLTDRVIVWLMLLATIAALTLSAAMLTNWHINYVTTGGNFYEKLHPATYFAVLSLCLLLVRNGDPIGEIDRMFSDAKLVMLFLLSWFALLIQMLVLERPFTAIIDTFLLPLVLCLIVWRLSPRQRQPLVWGLHLAILLNVIIGYYEYFSGHRLIPLTLGDVTVMGEWRSSALLGHPLTASGIVGGYVLALTFRPAICPPALLRLPLIAFCLGSLMAFGGRTALVTVLLTMGSYAAVEIVRILRGKRTSLPMAIGAICLLFIAAAGIFAMLDLGTFDKMLLRFSSDKGSAQARYATFDLLSRFDWRELVLGPNPARASALQNQLGLKYGIEDFWVASIVQFGIIHTILLTLGLVGLFAEILRRASGAAWTIVLLVFVVAASSVSFSSKNIQLAQFVLLITLLLPRDRRIAVPQGAPSGPASRRDRAPMPAVS
jgi:hypothetical protein